MKMLTMMVVAAVGIGVATLAPTATAAGGASKVDVCHYDKDADSYHLINISENAFDKHADHGDVSPGDAVPEMPGFEFDSSCEPQSVLSPGCIGVSYDGGTPYSFTGEFADGERIQFNIVEGGSIYINVSPLLASPELVHNFQNLSVFPNTDGTQTVNVTAYDPSEPATLNIRCGLAL